MPKQFAETHDRVAVQPVAQHTPEPDALLQAQHTGSAHPLLRLQQGFGNGYVQQLVRQMQAAKPAATTKAGLPRDLKTQAEAMSGVSMSGVTVQYNSPQPARLGAYAYTRGNDIHVGPSQENYLAHELWHVVQQRQGRVNANAQVGGQALNDDPHLEREADDMAQQLAGTVLPTSPEGAASEAMTAPASSSIGVVQRAIAVGTTPIPRTANMPDSFLQYLQKNGIEDLFKQLNDDRNFIYIFGSNEHLLTYLKDEVALAAGAIPALTVQSPLRQAVSATELAQNEGYINDIRFMTVYERSANQLHESAPGAHTIPQQMLPPLGSEHQWVQAPGVTPGQQQYDIFRNRLTNPTLTEALTYGDPQHPSLITNQGDQTLGMHMQPSGPAFLDPLSRNKNSSLPKDTLANIPLGPPNSGRVRGHAFVLSQNQKSTDPTSTLTLDKDRRTYTDESSSAQFPPGVGNVSGVSSWREKQIERVAIETGQPFTQINVNPTPGQLGGIARPSKLHFRRPDGGGGYDDILIDNLHNEDYKAAYEADKKSKKLPKTMSKKGKKRDQRPFEHQTERGRHAARYAPYPETRVRRPGERFDDVKRRKYPGYKSPPPSPFLTSSISDDLVGQPFPADIPGRVYRGEDVQVNGEECRVVEIIAYNNGHTGCRVQKIQKFEWPSFM